MIRPLTAELVLDLKAALTEGPLWHSARQSLYFVDILGRGIYEFVPDRGSLLRYDTPESVGCIVPRRGGGLVAALASGPFAFDPETAAFRPLAAPPEHQPGRCRFNDGKCDPQGRFWAGTMSLTGEPGAGALYCFAPARVPRQVLSGVSVSNGLAWSLDGHAFFYIDSRTRRVDAFDFDPETGALDRRRPVIYFPSGSDLPDGCALDGEGMLWIAHWRGGCVTRWNPATGKTLARIEVPAPHVTSCAFGGADGEVLYITTARQGLSSAQETSFPASGGIFACRPGVAGPPASPYAG